jgi:hypothetical protein
LPITAAVPQSANFAPKATIGEGLHQVVIFRVEDLGMVPVGDNILAKNRAQAQKEGRDPNSVKTAQPKARVFFNNNKGQFISTDYTLSLHEKAALTRDLKRLGIAFTDSFDVETLVGAQAQLMAEEAISGRGTKYVKIATLAKPSPGQAVKSLPNKPVTDAAVSPKPQTTAASAVVNSLEINDADLVGF